ncbi:hypothetical protein [Christensenella timonensis]|uniref:hypothetical protein n=1 Tax=Christensenella timonensis TaxID=1816678 RepID=UPI000832E2DB|nr:hypothetical protein [Christensenella timonensis]
MKNFLMVTFAALLLFSLAACSAPAAPEASPISPQGDAPAGGGQTPPDGAETKNIEMLYGKVKSLVGNTVALDLAKQPGGGDTSVIPEGAEPDTGGVPADGYDIAIDSSKSAAVTGGDEESGSDGEGGGISSSYFAEDENGNMIQLHPEDTPKLELEYTGETTELTIPAGLKIYDSIGKELKMSDLKEGNVLMVMQNGDGSIESITVME